MSDLGIILVLVIFVLCAATLLVIAIDISGGWLSRWRLRGQGSLTTKHIEQALAERSR